MKWSPTLITKREPASVFRDIEAKDDRGAVRRAAQGPGYVVGGIPYVSNWNVDKMVRDAFERVIWIARGVDVCAHKLSTLPVGCWDSPRAASNPKRTVLKDAALPLLNKRPNGFEKAPWFRYRLSAQLWLSPKGAFVEVVKDARGTPTELHLIPPEQVNPIPARPGSGNPRSSAQYLEGFRVTYKTQGGWTDLPAFDVDANDTNSVLWVRKPHPIDPYAAWTPLQSSALTIDLDFYQRLYNYNFMRNDGRGAMLVLLKDALLGEGEADRLERLFSGGVARAGETRIVEGATGEVLDLASTPRDTQYAQGRGMTKEELLLTTGTPESVIGNASGRTYDNADAERWIWYEATVLPHADIMEAAWDDLTEGGWRDDKYIEHDFSSIDVLNRYINAKQDKARADFAAGLITYDELREALGLEPLNVPASRVAYVPVGGFVPLGKDEADQEAAQALKPIAGAAPPSAGPPAVGLTADAARANARAGAEAGVAAGEAERAGMTPLDAPGSRQRRLHVVIGGKRYPINEDGDFMDETEVAEADEEAEAEWVGLR